ncbi:hypothetical protein SJDPG4_07630 [Porphyromonas gingivalis SJD4]|nr:hypothetical protein SJDPG4_07630 [Porphyromonas gingivalis SJD4]
MFLAALTKQNLLNSLLFGLMIWAFVIVLWIGVGFTTEEYYKRKKQIKKLMSDQYAFLDLHGFTLHEDLYFEGVYEGFFFRVCPATEYIKKGYAGKKAVEYVIIESFYRFASEPTDAEREAKMSGEYSLGDVHFENHCAGFVPKDWKNPDFKANFDALIAISKREGLLPITKNDWESTFGEHSKKAKDASRKNPQR